MLRVSSKIRIPAATLHIAQATGDGAESLHRKEETHQNDGNPACLPEGSKWLSAIRWKIVATYSTEPILGLSLPRVRG